LRAGSVADGVGNCAKQYEVDFTAITVRSVTGAASTVLPAVFDAAACGPDGGWYLNDRANPTEMLLCPTTCAADADAVEVGLFVCCRYRPHGALRHRLQSNTAPTTARRRPTGASFSLLARQKPKVRPKAENSSPLPASDRAAVERRGRPPAPAAAITN
jgi:hypothetical protein